MKTLNDIVEERFNPLFEAAEKEPGGQNSQAWANALDAEKVLYRIGDAERKGKYAVDYSAFMLLPAASFTRVGILRPKLSITCSKGHVFRCAVNKFLTMSEAGEEPCHHCRRNLALMSGPSHQAEARVRYYIQHDERGEEMLMDSYETATFGHVYQDRVSGDHYKTYAVNLHLWSRPQSKSKPVVWIVEDGEYAFLWTGDRPVVENPMIKDLFERADGQERQSRADARIELFYEPDVAQKKGYTHRKGLENAILQCIEDGAKVLNIGLNPQFKAPGIYEWGKGNAALAGWIEDIEAKWLAVRAAA